MRKFMLINLIVALSVLLAACGGAAAPADTSSSGQGAKVDVNAEHPSMAGMGMSGQATEQVGGKYSIKANFSDSGDWVLTIYVRKGELDYKEEIELPIQ